MPFDRGPVEDVQLRDICQPAVAVDALGDRLERREGATDEMHGRALAGVGAGDRGADRSGGTVDDRCLILEQHGIPPVGDVSVPVRSSGTGE
jgi:hypothetical protein